MKIILKEYFHFRIFEANKKNRIIEFDFVLRFGN